MAHVLLTEVSLQSPKFELDISIVVLYTYYFSNVTNSWVTFYHSWLFLCGCTLYYVIRNYACYGFSDSGLVFIIFTLLMLFNLLYCYEDEVMLRESFNKTQLGKQLKNSLHSVIEVFPEGILIAWY